MFVGQSFLIVPVLIYLNKKGAPILDSLRINIISKKTASAALILSLGAMVISDEINILIEKIIPAPESFLQLEALLTPENPISMIILITLT